jgi:Carboxypeptidase regulatory-like domain
MSVKTILLAFVASLAFVCPKINAQTPTTPTPTQTLKGTIIDKMVKATLPGATVQVIDPAVPTVAVKGASADADGQFRIAGIPLGRYTVVVRYLGYEEMIVPNVLLSAGKETELTLEMQESIIAAKEVVIVAKTDKRKPLNELSTVSARTFSIEETQRFAAAVNDPARMATSYAGVVAASDGNNHIVIRGNAPNGLLWRMEGVDIPNPNHFSNVGTAGGGISILSAQVLGNSDFSTGAFAAEYGNALSGVFDLKLRKGNADKREFTFQAGFLGFDAAVEGPFRMGKQVGSYLVNYRYSTLSLLSQIGVPLGDGRTDFQDLSFNIWMPAGKVGTFTLFGFGGLSLQTINGREDSMSWQEDDFRRYSQYFKANTGAVGMTHSKVWGSSTYLKTVIAASGTENTGEFKEYLLPDYKQRVNFENRFLQDKITVSSVFSHKFNSRHFVRAGAYVHFQGYKFNQSEWDDERNRVQEQIKSDGRTAIVNTFAQWQYRASKQLTFNAGVHNMYFALNKTNSLEPRAGVKYSFSDNQHLSFGYGLHSQTQPIVAYFTKNDRNEQMNPDLSMSKAHHFVLGYDRSIAKALHVKSELYYQYLFNIPVERDVRSPYSLINLRDEVRYTRLTNEGTGRNYGIELTVERFLQQGFYFLLSSSLYRSEYRGSDDVWRNSRYNGSTANTLTTGKEWAWDRKGKDRTIGLNLKVTQVGGMRTTPVDVARSIAAGETVRQTERAFEEQLPAYFRADAGVRLRRNYRKITTTLSLDVQNVTNRENVFDSYFDTKEGKVKYYYQTPLIPILAYKLEF